jgi:hypothetical protein
VPSSTKVFGRSASTIQNAKGISPHHGGGSEGRHKSSKMHVFTSLSAPGIVLRIFCIRHVASKRMLIDRIGTRLAVYQLKDRVTWPNPRPGHRTIRHDELADGEPSPGQHRHPDARYAAKLSCCLDQSSPSRNVQRVNHRPNIPAASCRIWRRGVFKRSISAPLERASSSW